LKKIAHELLAFGERDAVEQEIRGPPNSLPEP
jgi:hypothetical protein